MSRKTVFIDIRLLTMVNRLKGRFISSRSAHCHAHGDESQGQSNDVSGPNSGIYAIVMMSEMVGIDIHKIELITWSMEMQYPRNCIKKKKNPSVSKNK